MSESGRTIRVWMGAQPAEMVAGLSDAERLEMLRQTLCARSDCPIKPYDFCSKCRTVKYCSAECQNVHWPEHKLVCKELALKKKNEEAIAAASSAEVNIVAKVSKNTTAEDEKAQKRLISTIIPLVTTLSGVDNANHRIYHALYSLCDHTENAQGVIALMSPEVGLLSALANFLRTTTCSSVEVGNTADLVVQILATATASQHEHPKLCMRVGRQIAFGDHGLLEQMVRLAPSNMLVLESLSDILGNVCLGAKSHEVVSRIMSEQIDAPAVFIQTLRRSPREDSTNNTLLGMYGLSHYPIYMHSMVILRQDELQMMETILVAMETKGNRSDLIYAPAMSMLSVTFQAMAHSFPDFSFSDALVLRTASAVLKLLGKSTGGVDWESSASKTLVCMVESEKYISVLGESEHVKIALITTSLRLIRLTTLEKITDTSRQFCKLLWYLVHKTSVTAFRDLITSRAALLLKVQRDLRECFIENATMGAVQVRRANQILSSLSAQV